MKNCYWRKHVTYYLLQHRYVRTIGEDEPTFPAILTATIRFGPEDAFGMPGASTRTTAKKSTASNLLWNANEGTTFWEGELIDRIQGSINVGGFNVSLDGATMTLTAGVSSMKHAEDLLLSANHIFPAVLSFRLRVFVWIKEFLADIGGSAFRLETTSHRYGITIATSDYNRQNIMNAVADWVEVTDQSVRLIIAMYYFRHAERLACLEPNRQSMTAEVILNLTKVIDVFFSSNDELRQKAKEWGIDEDFIEKRIIPLTIIRSKLDVAHVRLTPLTTEQNQLLLDFTSNALSYVYTLLLQIVELQKNGTIHLDPISHKLDEDKEKFINDIQAYLTS